VGQISDLPSCVTISCRKVRKLPPFRTINIDGIGSGIKIGGTSPMDRAGRIREYPGGWPTAAAQRGFDAIAVHGTSGEDCESLAEAVRSQSPPIPLIFRLDTWDVRLSARLAHAGATAVYGPDTSLEEFLHEADVLAAEFNRQARRRLQEYAPWRGTIIGQSEAIRRVCDVIDRIADRKATVLITGESGTGKEIAARAIHMAGSRSKRPMLAVNCGAIPEGLLESELFGHVRGAFTGAVQQRAGLFEQPAAARYFSTRSEICRWVFRPKLLRVLQEQQFQRLGSSETVRVDVRIIAATNTRLEQLIREGRFREDCINRLKRGRDRHAGAARSARRHRAPRHYFTGKICLAEACRSRP